MLGEIHLQLDVDSEGMPAGISVPFTRVRAPTTGIIVRVRDAYFLAFFF